MGSGKMKTTLQCVLEEKRRSCFPAPSPEDQGHDPADLHKAIDRGYQWGDEIPIGLFWRRTDLPTLEELEPVLHTGEGPLAFRSNIGIPADQAQALIQELL